MGRPPSRSLIFDIYGAYLREFGGWIAISDLIALMAQLGIDEQAVRSAISRMSRRGLLRRREDDGVVGYELSDLGRVILEEGDLRMSIGGHPSRVEDGWALAIFSVPEGRRDMRHQLRSRLSFLGFGNLGSGVWIAPGRVLPLAQDAVAGLELERHVDLFQSHYVAFDDLSALMRRCWKLDDLEARYQALAEEMRPLVEKWGRRRRMDVVEAFIDYTLLLHQWRKMPYLDPGLPRELLPEDWIGEQAVELYAKVVDRLQKPARQHVEAVVKRENGARRVPAASAR